MYIKSWLQKNEFAANVAKLITGTALGQVITVLISPILTRLYSAEDFGILAIYLSVAGILSVVISFRFEEAVVLPSEENEAIDLVILGIGISLIFSIVLLFIFYSSSKKILDLIDHPELKFYLYLIPLSTFFYGCNQVLSYWMSRIKFFNPLAVSKTVKESSTVLTQLSLGGLIYTGAFGLIAGQIIGNAAAAGFLFWRSVTKIRSRLIPGLLSNLKNVFLKYKQFPLFTGWVALINSISQNIPALLLAAFFSPAIAGYFAIATRILTIPSILIGNSVRQVYYQKASALKNQGQPIFEFYKSHAHVLSLTTPGGTS